MSTKEIEKNFSLSADFGQYIINHPETLKNIPRNAQIVMGDEKDRPLTEKNVLMVKKAKGRFYQAVRQAKNGWKVRQIG
ncbi:MAG: hypothetical protein A3G49_04545 [Candidatus Sungbacteria bacterium RIFCSPLOWO2_12_FULL_41_11]|uniref:Uncharacterized protein n=1 Tax=Candidatus Sungbacteria bacterium RIFCSPLOWO2_12_FULL_41_11 TaxID=1802286 RepID=A0A1G2LQG1_9BACT|nr:MAG: hypothetical protein UV01_C0018G0017 [Parcubacteria group bacterium GW2011_GWA2_42_14]OGZ97938.1 MAG: hypothetical protein A3D41_00380 [Candidatus Sungbacteria bacterium RIFCSPHIGHO2_02_FULL_41_12b]OHA13846.1 MAG: hypothetical protein A3G49_04545 [Candidatus Sungbacteria bacterium RIFCSPLOWO2_12_FULL_41_11]